MKKTLPNGLAATALLLLPAGLLGQMTGTSHPESLNDTISTAPAPSSHYVKPSPAVPMQDADLSAPAAVSGPVLIPRTAPTSAAAPVVCAPAPLQTARLTSQPVIAEDPNSGVVLEVASAPNELPVGTLLHTGLSAEVSTITTQKGAAFSARLLQPAMRQGQILLPIGAVLTGRVAEVHAANRLHGGAVIQLIPEYIALPDGTRHSLRAQVVDLPEVHDASVNDEGVIHGRDNVKGTAAAVGLTTASATVAGAMIGGGVGAAVGVTVGAGAATVWWLKHQQEQTLSANTEIVFSLDQPLSVATGNLSSGLAR